MNTAPCSTAAMVSQFDMYVFIHCRHTLGAVVSGCGCGILGITGIYGFLFYICCFVVLAGFLLLRIGFKGEQFFGSNAALVSNTLSGGIAVRRNQLNFQHLLAYPHHVVLNSSFPAHILSADVYFGLDVSMICCSHFFFES